MSHRLTKYPKRSSVFTANPKVGVIPVVGNPKAFARTVDFPAPSSPLQLLEVVCAHLQDQYSDLAFFLPELFDLVQ